MISMTINSNKQTIPSEEFELTANSLGAHFEDTCYLTVNSQDDSLCEPAVSFL